MIISHHNRMESVGISGDCEERKWWALQGSNLRHSACKADALPTELSARNLEMSSPLHVITTASCFGVG